jgi:serine protease AprX
MSAAFGVATIVLATGWAQAAPVAIAAGVAQELNDHNGVALAWITFADKGDAASRAAAIDDLKRTYNADAMRRRQLRRTDPGLFDARDLPVCAENIDVLRSTGVQIRAQSRWLNSVSVRGTRSQINAIAKLPSVTHISTVARSIARPAEHVQLLNTSVFGSRDTINYGFALNQLTQINLPALHAAGFTGQGVIVGILDTGFVRTHAVFKNPAKPLQVVAERDFINDDNNAGQEPGDPAAQGNHGTYILGTLAAYLPGSLVGGAFDAKYVLCKTEVEPTETQIEEDYFVEGLEFAELNGADLVTASLGYDDWYTQADFDGTTAVTTRAVNIATANGVHFTVAAGNNGWDTNASTSTLGAPADAFDAITCGAVNVNGVIASFSSSGPTADGRIKPEVLARGVSTVTVAPNSDVNFYGVSGTSLSTPLVAGAVACLVQARPTWTVAQMRQYLIENSSRSVAGVGSDPMFVLGYGIMNAGRILTTDCNGNGVSDFSDIGGPSSDRNHDNIPDECGRACLADYNLDGFLDFTDFDDFVSDFEVGRTTADANSDGFLDFTDFDSFVDAFALGC